MDASPHGGMVDAEGPCFRHSSLRRAMTTWVAYAEERRSRRRRLARSWYGSRRRAARSAAPSTGGARRRRRRATLRALAAVVHRRTVAAVNTWQDVAADATARRRRLSSALHRMTPRARAARALARPPPASRCGGGCAKGWRLCSRELRAAFVTLRDLAAAAPPLARPPHSRAPLVPAPCDRRVAGRQAAAGGTASRVDPPRAPRCVEPLGRPHQIMGLRRRGVATSATAGSRWAGGRGGRTSTTSC